MGRRKSKKKVQVRIKPKVDTVFDCPFCNHSKTVECKLKKKEGLATVRCRVCEAQYQMLITELTQPVDVYSEWVDECETQNRRTAHTQAGDGFEDEPESNAPQIPRVYAEPDEMEFSDEEFN